MTFPSNHFLSLERPDMQLTVPEAFGEGYIDISTLASHDFDVDTRSGFMPPQPPLERLPLEWAAWEAILQSAIDQQLKLGDREDLIPSDLAQSETWRAGVREMPILTTSALAKDERVLRRAHHVLAWIMHFYIHSLPPTAEIRIPASITVPHLRVCAQLRLPPVLTYSDDVLYNWALKENSPDCRPTVDNIKSQTLFTLSRDEEEFYLSSARIELRGVEALELMRATMDEAFVGDDIAFRRITGYLLQMASVITELKALIMTVRDGCDPEVFYNEIRPWFRGMDSDPGARQWIFEGLELDDTLSYPTELSGPSAGQSSLIHALDIFLSVDRYSHSSAVTGHAPASAGPAPPSFLTRMQSYMPRHHRGFLNHLSSNPRPLRDLVAARPEDAELLSAYNAAVLSLKQFRDSHMIIVTLYIVGPARRAAQAKVAREQALAEAAGVVEEAQGPLKGTGGTDLVRFLKEVRDRTAGAIMAHTPN